MDLQFTAGGAEWIGLRILTEGSARYEGERIIRGPFYLVNTFVDELLEWDPSRLRLTFNTHPGDIISRDGQ
jgi:hypothetical protein